MRFAERWKLPGDIAEHPRLCPVCKQRLGIAQVTFAGTGVVPAGVLSVPALWCLRCRFYILFLHEPAPSGSRD